MLKTIAEIISELMNEHHEDDMFYDDGWYWQKGKHRMSEEQAREIISQLSYEEKIKLYELLSNLEQKRQPA